MVTAEKRMIRFATPPVDMKDEDRSSSLLLSYALNADQHGTELVSLLLSHGASIGVMNRTALQAATALGESFAHVASYFLWHLLSLLLPLR